MQQEPEHLKVLLGKRKSCYKSGSYGFPGGRLELTESLVKCAKRELFEETSVQADNPKYLGLVRELQDGYNFIHFGFVCTKWSGEIVVSEPDKCESWEFFPLDTIPPNTLPAHKAGAKLLKSKFPTYIDLI